MKTSDKILLYSSVSAIGIFLLMDVLHYINYKRGKVLDFAAIEQRDFISHEEDGVHWLVLDGPMRATFYPADRLKIDVDRHMAPHFKYERVGDALFLTLEDHSARNAHDAYNNYGSYPAVKVFFPPMKGIRLINGFAIFDNEQGRKGVNATLQLDSTQCWVGHYDQFADTVVVVEPWDTLHIKGVNSNFILNRQVHVKALDLRMDANSEMSDRFAIIDTAYIQGDSTTVLHLRGRNFKKLHLDEVVRPTP